MVDDRAKSGYSYHSRCAKLTEATMVRRRTSSLSWGTASRAFGGGGCKAGCGGGGQELGAWVDAIRVYQLARVMVDAAVNGTKMQTMESGWMKRRGEELGRLEKC